MWVLRIRPRSPARAVSALNCYTISSAQILEFLILYNLCLLGYDSFKLSSLWWRDSSQRPQQKLQSLLSNQQKQQEESFVVSLWQGLHSSSAQKLHKIDYYPLAPRKVFWDHSSEDGVKWGRQTGSSRGKQTKSNPKEDWKPLQIWYMHNKIACFKISPTSLIAKKDGGSAGQGPLPVPFLVKDLYFHHYPCVSGPTLVPRHRNLGISAGALWTLTHAYSDSTTEVLLDYVLACLAFIKGVFV